MFFAPLVLSSWTAGTALAGNYLVIIADDLGTDKVSSYDDDDPVYDGEIASGVVQWRPETPTIDGLAAAGARFTNAWANPSCTPTRASLQTGAYAFRHGLGKAIEDDDPGILPGEWPDQLLGELFSAGGYATGYFGKWHVGSKPLVGEMTFIPKTTFSVVPHPVRLGYERFHGTVGGMMDPGYHQWPLTDWKWLGIFVDPGSYSYETTHATEDTTDAALTWIGEQEALGEDWFAIVSYHAPHSSQGGWLYTDLPASCPAASAGCLADESCADRDRAVYEALTECMDDEIDRLIDGLGDTVLDETLIVFMGDNGTPDDVLEGVYATYAGGKSTVFETGIRVPLIVTHGSTLRTGAASTVVPHVVTAPVLTLDLHRTLTDDAVLAGVTIAPNDARGFGDCFGTTAADCGRSAHFHYTEKFELNAVGGVIEGIAAVRKGTDRKMQVQYNTDDLCLDDRYFDLAVDPHEQNPITTPANWKVQLRNHMSTLHLGTGSWADGVPFCP